MSDNSNNSRRRERRKRNKNREANNLARRKDPSARSGSPGASPRRVIVPVIPPPPKMPVPVCARCGKPIQDITSALADKSSGAPVHFDCVLSFLQASEKIESSESILYIGQGRFAVVEYKDPADKKKFSIIRVIEWEGRESRAEWRENIASHYSNVH